MTRILCIRLLNWPIQRLLLCQPELLKTPIMLHATVRNARQVTAFSPDMAEWGVYTGMPWAEAVAIADAHCSEKEGQAVFIAQHSPEADRRMLIRIAEACRRFSPVVGFAPNSPDVLLLDVSHLRWMRGACLQEKATPAADRARRERLLARRIARFFKKRGVQVRLAIADTVGGAWAAAHFLGRTGRIVRIAPGRTSSVLRSLPIDALRLPQETVDLLRNVGIATIRQFAAIPPEEVVSRLGMAPLTCYRRAIGEIDEPIDALPMQEKFRLERSLEYPLGGREALEAIVAEMTRRIVSRVREKGRRLLRIDWRIDCEKNGRPSPIAFSVGLHRPTASPERVCSLVLEKFGRLRLPGPTWGFHVEVPLHVRASAVQRDLFGDRCSSGGLPSDLIEQLASRLGDDAVVGVCLRKDAQPEKAYIEERLVASDVIRRRRRRKRRTHELPPRPSRLLPKPSPISKLEFSSTGRLVGFLWNGRRREVAKCWGPERIETGWWRGPYERRDYYRLETRDGRRLWIFRHLRTGQWFLHGVFG